MFSVGEVSLDGRKIRVLEWLGFKFHIRKFHNGFFFSFFPLF